MYKWKLVFKNLSITLHRKVIIKDRQESKKRPPNNASKAIYYGLKQPIKASIYRVYSKRIASVMKRQNPDISKDNEDLISKITKDG